MKTKRAYLICVILMFLCLTASMIISHLQLEEKRRIILIQQNTINILFVAVEMRDNYIKQLQGKE